MANESQLNVPVGLDVSQVIMSEIFSCRLLCIPSFCHIDSVDLLIFYAIKSFKNPASCQLC